MRGLRLELSPGAALAAALLLALLRAEELAALALALLIHELGHLAAILALAALFFILYRKPGSEVL